MEDSSCMDLMSHDEECCLKTALAFAVLRQRLVDNDDEEQEPPSFVGGLFSNTISTLPTTNNNTTSHLQKMMQVAIATASAMSNKDNNDDTRHYYATLEGLVQHLALQLHTSTTIPNDWIQETLTDTKNTIGAVCTVWHGILQAKPVLGGQLLPAIGHVLQDLYQSTTESEKDREVALRMVKLLELAEASVSIRLSTSTAPHELLQELTLAMGPQLCLPIAKKELAYFVLRHKRPGNKMMLRYFCYDLMEKLSSAATCSSQST